MHKFRGNILLSYSPQTLAADIKAAGSDKVCMHYSISCRQILYKLREELDSEKYISDVVMLEIQVTRYLLGFFPI